MRDLSRVSKLFRVSCGVLKRKTAKTENGLVQAGDRAGERGRVAGEPVIDEMD